MPAHPDVHLLTPCNREEADSRMMLHVAHVAQHDHHQVWVNTVDTDVVLLAMMVAATVPAGMEVWLAFGAGKHLPETAAHQVAACL